MGWKYGFPNMVLCFLIDDYVLDLDDGWNGLFFIKVERAWMMENGTVANNIYFIRWGVF